MCHTAAGAKLQAKLLEDPNRRGERRRFTSASMGKNDWCYANPGHWEAPEDTTISAGAPRYFRLQAVTTRPSKAHSDLGMPAETKGYAARGDDSMKAAGGSGWFEPPDDTTVSVDTPDWFKVAGVDTQKVAPKKGRGSSLSAEAASAASIPRRKPTYLSEQHSRLGGRPEEVILRAKEERWTHDRHGSEDPVGTPTRYASQNKLVGTAGNGEPWMRSPGVMDSQGYRKDDGPLIGKGGFRPLAAERSDQEREQRAKRIESWGGKPPPSAELAAVTKKAPKADVPMANLTQVTAGTRGRTRAVTSFDRYCVQEEWRNIPKAERRRAPPAAWAQGAASIHGPPQPTK